MKRFALVCVILIAGGLMGSVNATVTVDLTDCFAWSDYPQSGFDRKGFRAVDRSGFADGAHTCDAADMWLEHNVDARLFIDMHGEQTITAISIWNYNEVNLTYEGFKRIKISYSDDCIDWVVLYEDETLAEAPGTDSYDSPDVLTLSSSVNCRYLKLECLENYGGEDGSGLSEVVITATGQATCLSPDDDNPYMAVDSDVTLSWSMPDSALGAFVYFGTNASTVKKASYSSSAYQKFVQDTSYDIGTLVEGQTYYWRIDVLCGAETVKGNVWSFTVDEDSVLASSPSPRDFAEGIDSEVELTWTAGSEATQHDVYVGTDQAKVGRAGTTSSLYQGRFSEASCELQGLSDNTRYFWRVDEIDADGNVEKGLIWDFTVSEYSNDHDIAAPDHLYVIELEQNLSDEENILLQTLAGVVAKDKPEIFISQEQSRVWLDDLVQNYGVTCTYNDSLDWYVEHFQSRCNGYILYDYDDKDSINVAVSLCGFLNTVACDTSLASYLKGYGYYQILDARDKDDEWLFDKYWSQMSDKGIVAQNRNIAGFDWVTATGMMALTGEDRDFCDTVYDNIIPCSPRFGFWEKYADDAGEYSNTSLISEHSMYSVSFMTPNLTVYTGIGNGDYDFSFEQKIRDNTYTTQEGKHYVTFIMSDMDNCYLLSRMNWISLAFNNNNRGQFDMGWAMNLSYIKYAPSIMEWWYRNASEHDAFVTCLSGMGFMYPSMFPELQKQCQQLSRYMEKGDTRMTLVQDWETVDEDYFETVVDNYASIEPLKAIVFNDGSGTFSESMWYKGKMIVPTHYSLWEGLASASDIATAINARSTDPTDLDSYSVVYIHTWSKDLDDVAETISLFDDDVVVVTPEELLEQMRANASLKNESFESPSVSTSTSVTKSFREYFYDWMVSGGVASGGLVCSSADAVDGSQYAELSLTAGSSNQGVTLSQTICKAIPAADYEFSIAVRENSGSGSSCTINLLFDETVVASETIVDFSSTEWTTLQVSAIADEGDADKMVNIEIVLENPASSSLLDLDDVSVSEWLVGDINEDDEVDADDLIEFGLNWLSEETDKRSGDFDQDGIVGFSDFMALSENWCRSL